MRLDLEHLTKRFDAAAPVLNDITFSTETRSLAVIGSSGCGKSTFLRILGGLILPSSGDIRLEGTPIPQTEAELLQFRRRLGFVFQQGNLFRHMTVLENITLPLVEVHGWEREAAKARRLELLERFGLADHAGKLPAELSGGQQQRAAIARAVAPKPKLLLLDEPTSALDPEYTAEVLDVVAELQEEGIEFVIVTHEMGFARKACEKTAFIHAGKILECRASAELFQAPQAPELRHFLGRILEWNA